MYIYIYIVPIGSHIGSPIGLPTVLPIVSPIGLPIGLRQQPGPGPARSWAGPAWFKMLLGLGGTGVVGREG